MEIEMHEGEQDGTREDRRLFRSAYPDPLMD